VFLLRHDYCPLIRCFEPFNYPQNLNILETCYEFCVYKASQTLRDMLYNLRMRNILIVDDTATNLRILELLLKKLDCNVFNFATPDDCIKWARNNINNVDLAILDFQMPNMDGDELAAILRELGCISHIIILTAHSALAIEMLNEKAEITTIINKPISITDVKYMLTRWSERGKTVDARRESHYPYENREPQEVFLYKNGFYKSFHAECTDKSANGIGFQLSKRDLGIISTADEILLEDGGNYSVRWSRLINGYQHFGSSRIL